MPFACRRRAGQHVLHHERPWQSAVRPQQGHRQGDCQGQDSFPQPCSALVFGPAKIGQNDTGQAAQANKWREIYSGVIVIFCCRFWQICFPLPSRWIARFLSDPLIHDTQLQLLLFLLQCTIYVHVCESVVCVRVWTILTSVSLHRPLMFLSIFLMAIINDNGI